MITLTRMCYYQTPKEGKICESRESRPTEAGLPVGQAFVAEDGSGFSRTPEGSGSLAGKPSAICRS